MDSEKGQKSPLANFSEVGPNKNWHERVSSLRSTARMSELVSFSTTQTYKVPFFS